MPDRRTLLRTAAASAALGAIPTVADAQALDPSVFASAAAHTTVQLQPGTYTVNPTTLANPGVTFLGAPGRRTTIRNASSGPTVFTLAAERIRFEDIAFDGTGGVSGDYWNGLVYVANGAHNATFRECRFQNTSRGGIYAAGARHPTIDRCEFTEIGRPGAGTGGAAVMFDGGVDDGIVTNNYAYGRLSSNFLKTKSNNGARCDGTLVENNICDYRSVTTVDALWAALAIEMFAGSWYSRVMTNHIYGPNVATSGGPFFGISLGGAHYSQVQGNIALGGTNILAMEYGIEVAECPHTSVVGNTIANAKNGINLTNDSPPSHGVIIAENQIHNIYEYGIITDSGPSGVRIHDNTLVDFGVRGIFLNSHLGHAKYTNIHDNALMIDEQTRLDPEGHIFGVYVVADRSSDTTPVDIHDNYFGPYPGGSSTRGIVAVRVNNPRGVRVYNNRGDGARPSNGAATAQRFLMSNATDTYVSQNRTVNYLTA